MSKIKDLKKSLPDSQYEFSLECQGAVTGKSYEGSFEGKIMNNREQAKVAKNKAFLNAGFDATLDVGTKNLHHMVSYLKFALTSAPSWFTESDFGYDLFDANVVEEIYGQVIKAEEAWYRDIWGDLEAPEKDNGSKED